MKTFRPSRRIWPAVFIGNTAAKEDRGSILSRISSSPRTHRCNAIVWRRSIAAISGATSRASAYFRRSKPTICPSTVRIACQRNRSAAKIGRCGDQMALRQIGRYSDQLIPGVIQAVHPLSFARFARLLRIRLFGRRGDPSTASPPVPFGRLWLKSSSDHRRLADSLRPPSLPSLLRFCLLHVTDDSRECAAK